MSKRRTQEERRTQTIGKLIDATVESLADRGYAASSTSVICKRAEVSQGGLFNHFGKRIDLIVATTEAICRAHLEQYAAAGEAVGQLQGDLVMAVVRFIRDATRTPEHAAWHEVMVAARTDDELRERIAPSVRAFEQALLTTAADVLEVPVEHAERFGIVALSIMHMFDSEAVTTAVYPNEDIERARLDWAAAVLRTELERARST